MTMSMNKQVCMEQHGWISQTCLVEAATAAAAKSLQSCPTLCNPRDGSPPGSPIPGILQARTLEWVAIFFSIVYCFSLCIIIHNVCVCVQLLSFVWLFVTTGTAACQALSVGFFTARILKYSTPVGCHFLLQGIFPTQGLNPCLSSPLHCRQILCP